MMDSKHAGKPASKKHLFLRVFSLGFLAVFVLTVIFGLLISGPSLALFTATSNTITMNFSAEEAPGPSLQENYNHLIAQVRESGSLKDSKHFYRATGQNPADAWSRNLEDYLKGNNPDGNIFGFQNPVSGSMLIYNQPTLPAGGNTNPAVYITEYGTHINFSSGAPESLWGTIIVYSAGNNPNDTQINYMFVDELGNVSDTFSDLLSTY